MKIVSTDIDSNWKNKEKNLPMIIMQETHLVDPTAKIIKSVKPSLKDKFNNAKYQYKEYKRLKNRIGKLVNDWEEIMYNIKMFNEANDTFCLSHIQEQDKYGWSCRIYAPWGKPLELLETAKPAIESGLHCMFYIDIPEHKEFALAKIIYPNLVKHNEMPFYPVRVKPYQFYAGVKIDGTPQIFNVVNTPQILLAGMQRKGKNGSFDHAMTSWIYSCSEKEIEIYLFQCAKNEMIKYKDCKQVRCYIEGNLDEMEIALKYIYHEMLHRKKLFESMVVKAEGDDNIFKYNKLHPKKPLPYIYIVLDEFIELMPNSDTDDKETKKQKLRILNSIRQIGQWGGTYGVNYICLHQKPEKALMPSFIKNMSSIRICFGFDDLVCCAIVIGDEFSKYAYRLPPRKAFFTNNESNGYIYTNNLTGRIKEFIKDSIRPYHRTVFDDIKDMGIKIDPIPIEEEEIEIDDNALKDFEEDFEEETDEIKEEEFFDIEEEIKNINLLETTIAITDDEIEKNNINPNIPNFVPYVPISPNVNIRDETKLDLSKSQKPPKRKDV